MSLTWPNSCRSTCNQGDTFFDAGANFGFWSLYAGRIVGSSGRVIACEPAPEVYRVLTESSKHCDVLTPLHVGLGSRDAVVPFAAQGTSEWSSFCREVTRNSQHWKPRVSIVDVPVTMRRVDSIVEELKLRPTVMKIDVEGFELEVLKGAEDTLDAYGCALFMRSILISWVCRGDQRTLCGSFLQRMDMVGQ